MSHDKARKMIMIKTWWQWHWQNYMITFFKKIFITSPLQVRSIWAHWVYCHNRKNFLRPSSLPNLTISLWLKTTTPLQQQIKKNYCDNAQNTSRMKYSSWRVDFFDMQTSLWIFILPKLQIEVWNTANYSGT